jgi:hypothetical protein
MHRGIKNLAEPFTPGHIMSLKDIGISETDFNSYEEQVSKVISQIRSISNSQSLIMKLFLHSWILSSEHERIIQLLRELNFQFIIIKRKNIFDQLLSLGIGLKLNKFTNFDDYDDTVVELDIDILSKMKVLQNDLVNFDNLLNKYDLSNCITMHYETIKEDLSEFLGKSLNINTRYRRMSNINSQSRISNIQEVITFLNTL